MAKRFTTSCLLLIVMTACAAAGHAASIRGTLTLAPRRTKPAPKTKPVTTWTHAVVWLDHVPDKVERRLARSAQVSRVIQSRQQFSPTFQVVPVGSRVVFENRDKVFHHIFTRSPENRFETGQYAPKQTRHARFDSVGIVQLYCAIHPEMAGKIFVVPNHAWLRPSADGSFEFTGLPGGKYVVRSWHPVHGKLRQEVTIPFLRNAEVQLAYGSKKKAAPPRAKATNASRN